MKHKTMITTFLKKEHTGNLHLFQNPFPADNFKNYGTKTNLKITILKILVCKIQPEIIKSKIFKVETHKNFRFYNLWLCFVYRNF